ncbi:MAG: helix-turn-helix transcriptional regulator [Caldilineaceae bacterium]
MDSQLINTIFGMKIRQARTEARMTLTELAAECDLSPSYLTEVEKGRKYPRADKIIRMASALKKNYDELVSITLAPSLADLETALASPLLHQIPFEEFGFTFSDLIDLLTRVPDRASALLHAILDVARQFNLKEENFLLAILRSYQEINDNHFPEIEEMAARFAKDFKLESEMPITLARLEEILHRDFSIRLDTESLMPQGLLGIYRSIFVKGGKSKLLLNPDLSSTERRFCIAREIGYLVLGLNERAYTSSRNEVRSFSQVLNDFKASYFAAALLLPKAALLADLNEFFALPTWQPEYLLALLDKYDVTPEVLLYRFSELIPQYFGLKMHFLRVREAESSNSKLRYRLVKQLNMNRLLLPSGLALDEHFCRRWLVVELLRELRNLEEKNAEGIKPVGKEPKPIVGIQLSEFFHSHDRFLCFGFARSSLLPKESNSSMIVGFRVDTEFYQTVRFASDPTIPFVIINETCERCPLSNEQCPQRAAPPTVLQNQTIHAQRQQALAQLLAQLQG